jgi:lipase chaperone LimK
MATRRMSEAEADAARGLTDVLAGQPGLTVQAHHVFPCRDSRDNARRQALRRAARRPDFPRAVRVGDFGGEPTFRLAE